MPPRMTLVGYHVEERKMVESGRRGRPRAGTQVGEEKSTLGLLVNPGLRVKAVEECLALVLNLAVLLKLLSSEQVLLHGLLRASMLLLSSSERLSTSAHSRPEAQTMASSGERSVLLKSQSW